MRVKTFEAYVRDVLAEQGHEEIEKVRTFEEAGYTTKPVGVVVTMVSGAEVFMQFVRTSPPGGEDFSQPEYAVTGAEIV